MGPPSGVHHPMSLRGLPSGMVLYLWVTFALGSNSNDLLGIAIMDKNGLVSVLLAPIPSGEVLQHQR